MTNNTLDSLDPAALPTGLRTDRAQETRWVVQAVKPVEYEVRMVAGLLDPASSDLATAGTTDRTGNRRFVVVDAHVHELYGDRIRAYLDRHGLTGRLCVLPAGEEAKTMESVLRVVRGIDEFGISRRHDPVIAIGGGVLLDIVGFAASMYRRSTPYVRVPTTLIGLVDAGVGVKTGINFDAGKNRLGTYAAPAVSLLDRTFLTTLDRRHLSNGLAEILKIALVKDARLFALLESHAEELIETAFQGRFDQDPVAAEVLERAIHGMLEELQPNLWESRLERLVDYGHTFSPTLEMDALPALLHGEAVNLDMALTTVIGRRRGLVTDAEQERALRVMRRLELPLSHPVCTGDRLEKALADTVRHRDGLQRLPLPVGIGDACFANDVTPRELHDAAEELAQLESTHAR